MIKNKKGIFRAEKVVCCAFAIGLMGILTGCQNGGSITPDLPHTTPTPDIEITATPVPTATPIPTPTPIVDVPEGRYDAAINARTEADEVPVVNHVDSIEGVFNPFYCESETDKAIVDLTQISLLDVDEDGNVHAGIEYPCLAYSVEELPYATSFAGGVDGLDSNWKAYRIVLKEGITFADGTPVKAEDVIYSVKTLADLNYTGPCTISALNILGMRAYHTHVTESTRETAQRCAYAGITGEGTMPDDFDDSRDWNEVWSYMDEAGIRMAQDIIDYVNSTYDMDAYAQMFLSTNVTYNHVKASDNLKTVYAMVVWGYLKRQSYNFGTNKIRDYQNVVHDLNEEVFNAETFWKMIREYYGYNLSSADGINYESAISGKLLEDYIIEAYCDDHKTDVELFGVKPFFVQYDDGSVRNTIDVLIDESENIADFNFYVAEKSFYEGNEHSNDLHGAGEYKLTLITTVSDAQYGENANDPEDVEVREDIRVELEANDSYMLGSPKTHYITFTTEPEVIEENSDGSIQ